MTIQEVSYRFLQMGFKSGIVKQINRLFCETQSVAILYMLINARRVWG